MAEGYGGGKLLTYLSKGTKAERGGPGMRDAPAWSTHFSNAITMSTLVIDSPLRLWFPWSGHFSGAHQ